VSSLHKQTATANSNFFGLIFAVSLLLFFQVRIDIIQKLNPKTSIRWKDLGDHLHMLPILCQISLPWQRGLTARPQQPPT